MSAFDHFLNALNIALKTSEKPKRQRREGGAIAERGRSFGTAPAVEPKNPGVALPKDPSCCLARRGGS